MTSMLRTPLLPSPYFSEEQVSLILATGATVPFGAAVWPAANRALYVPTRFPARVTIEGLCCGFSAAAGNMDLGLYDADLNLIQAKGTTAVTATVMTLTLTNPLEVQAGRTLFAGMVCSDAATATAYRWTGLATAPNLPNWAQEALGGTSLPNPATPAAPGSAYVPVIGYLLRRTG